LEAVMTIPTPAAVALALALIFIGVADLVATWQITSMRSKVEAAFCVPFPD
jgi:hypothetical protein